MSDEIIDADFIELPTLSGKAIEPNYDLYPREEPRPLELLSVTPIYERQPGEPLEDHQKFLIYCSLEPNIRSLTKAYAKWAGKDKVKSPSVTFSDIARHWHWEERAQVLDIARIKKTEEIWMYRDIQRREKDWDVGEQLRDKALIALSDLDTEDLSPNTILNYLELASKMQKEVIPQIRLDTSQAQNLLKMLPDDRREKVIRILAAQISVKGT